MDILDLSKRVYQMYYLREDEDENFVILEYQIFSQFVPAY